jgi:hypothetical protein
MGMDLMARGRLAGSGLPPDRLQPKPPP